MSEEMIPHVHSDGRFIEWLPRSDIHRRRLVHRSIHVLVFHPDGRLLVQLRHRDKQTLPHHWDVSCSGHVDSTDHPIGDGEHAESVFWSAARREISEELGVSPTLEFVKYCPPVSGVNYEYAGLFRATCEGPFKIQEEELEETRWVTPESLKTLSPITPNLTWLINVGDVWR